MKLDFGMIEQLVAVMREEEKSRATVEKYARDVKAFIQFVGEGVRPTKELVISFKKRLEEKYALTSANSMLAAVNYFLKQMGMAECAVKAFKVQKENFRPAEKELTKEEYQRLLDAAEETGNHRLNLVMQTICSTGIRVSELRFITVEAIRTRRARVFNKGRGRTVLLPLGLCRLLAKYVKEKGARSGSVFVTRNGKPLDRSNILHAMKKLCRIAGVAETKAFPHNLRHLFAATYYKTKKNISHLADLLGHSSINTTRIYTASSCEEQERELDGLGLCSCIWIKTT